MEKDPYRYFRIEAQEIGEGLGQAVLELEKGGDAKAILARMLRLAHTLKGAARVVRQTKLGELAHAIEDAFAPYRDGDVPIPKEVLDGVLGLLDAIGKGISELDRPTDEAKKDEPAVALAPAANEELFQTVRVEIDEMDRLLDGVAESAVQVTGLRKEVDGVERARHLTAMLLEQLTPRRAGVAGGARAAAAGARAHALAGELAGELERHERSLVAGIDLIQTELRQVRDATNRLRLLPASTVFASLERATRDAAQALLKDVAFSSSGGDNRLDAHVLASLRSALLHVVRNAVAHGIEPPAERAKTGKPAQGQVEVRVEHRGNRAAFVCRDDGRGIDVEAVRRAAVRRGLVAASAADALGVDEVLRLILEGGVTTKAAVDEISGRGVGLDVVREAAALLKGEVILRSEPGRGTTVEVVVPVSLASLAALEVDAGGNIASLPLDAVRRTLRIVPDDVVRSADRESILYEGEVIPYLPLVRVLRAGRQRAQEAPRRNAWSAVVLEASSGLAAVGVDRLLGTADVIVRPLPILSSADAAVAGASLDAEGNPRLVLDAEGLVARAYRGKDSTAAAHRAKRLPVLVIDDSLTTRMLEQSILECAGYEVDVATSAEEALVKARLKHYGLFLVDVEMPGMSGFEFVALTRADTALKETPAILVTSRDAPEDRLRGRQAGAHAYVVKGEFDQAHLLQMIQELIG